LTEFAGWCILTRPARLRRRAQPEGTFDHDV
jgi:hypothetical protein